MRYRKHARTLAESLATSVEIGDTFEDLVAHLADNPGLFSRVTKDNLFVKFYCHDDRCDEDVYHVMYDHDEPDEDLSWVLGQTDAMPIGAPEWAGHPRDRVTP